jgi:hypothetical protein
MEMDYQPTPPNSLHDKRALNKLGLETFALDYVNRFDYAASTAIGDLKGQLAICFQKDSTFKANRKKKPQKQEDNAELFETSYSENADEHDNLSDIIYIAEEIQAYEEMKVIYAYKHFEIHFKRLMSATYPNLSSRELYRWENSMAFLKSRGIKPAQLDSFKEVDELRRVNNAVKHSAETDTETEKISEFVGKQNFSYGDLGSFYERVKNTPAIFLESLSTAIYNDLYQFDDARIENLVVDFVKRMEPDVATKLCERLHAHYF